MTPAPLPAPRGDLSAAVLGVLSAGDPPGRLPAPPPGTDPYGEDLHLALHLCYELHYQGLEGVPDRFEWDPALLTLRAALEDVFLTALHADTAAGDDVDAALGELLVEPAEGGGVAGYLLDEGRWWQMREYLTHRSVYHLKEADPHAWVIPRLDGQAKASLVAVEFDEFGGGHGARVHARLFADALTGAGLDPGYLHHLDDVPAPAIAIVNMMSMFGLHRALRGALVGHFAAAEISTAPSARKMAKALERMEAAAACAHFFTEHIEADAVHEQVMRREVLGDLLGREPELAADVVLGIRATEHLEDRLAHHLLTAWRRGTTSLRRPLADSPPTG
ncbi:iron-containing redox enzyme family protein [Streptomyces sp. TRM 70351]|uniref:iron-containing redox enzyme family protein n=1 Tax=Streptomyces sp. TRM 70351 TaxID=3116552 RepID=UPI002E7B21F7|nr:iron-containing redox enzyme family protein [Streptomyces sp. TRM 70351]MEE1930763.1 iron-containing redox enzyme family protein [Streptomyces sp. TRM 70351]